MNNKEKLYLAKSATTLSEDQRNMIANFIKKNPAGAPKGDTDLGDPNSAVIKNYRYNTGRKGNDSGMNQRLSHQADIERMEDIKNPTWEQRHKLMNAKAPWNPINRYATTGGYGQGVNLGQKMREKSYDGGKEVTMGSMLKNAPGTAFELAAGGIDEIHQSGVMDPTPALEGLAGIPLDVVRGADMYMQGAGGAGYQERDWLKDKPSFVGGVKQLGTSMYNKPGETAMELLTGRGSFWNVMGGAGTLGRLGKGSGAARASSVAAPARVPTPPPATGLGRLGHAGKKTVGWGGNKVKDQLNLNLGGTNRLANPKSKLHQVGHTTKNTAKEILLDQEIGDANWDTGSESGGLSSNTSIPDTPTI